MLLQLPVAASVAVPASWKLVMNLVPYECQRIKGLIASQTLSETQLSAEDRSLTTDMAFKKFKIKS